MAANVLEGIEWYVDQGAKQRGEPGICHSFMASLVTAVNHIEGDIDPVWVMGASGFAFRIFMNKNLCPSAMSMFDFSAVLPEAVEQVGYRCRYVSRMWDEKALEKERREEGHTAIVEGIDQGRPAVVWDVAGCEWGLIVGYDKKRKEYTTLTSEGQPSTLKYKKLGRNGIDILSVSIPGQRNERSREEVVRKSLEMAVKHAENREWIDRPEYQDGLAGLEMWADIMDLGATMAEAGKLKCCGADALEMPRYFAGIIHGTRCYARDYLRAIANGDAHLEKAAGCYEEVATCLQTVWDSFGDKEVPGAETFRSLGQNIRAAKEVEKEGIECIKAYIEQKAGDVSAQS